MNNVLILLSLWIEFACGTWNQLGLQFSPSTSSTRTNLNITMEPGLTLSAGWYVSISLPGVTSAESSINYEVFPAEFVGTLGYLADWNADTSELTFFLTSGWSTGQGLNIICGDLVFTLPPASVLNSAAFTVEIISSNGVGVLYGPDSFLLVDQVFPSAEFLFSELFIEDLQTLTEPPEEPLEKTIIFRFSVNRPLESGQAIELILPGYQSVRDVLDLAGDWASYFKKAHFDSPSNKLRLELGFPIYFSGSGKDLVEISIGSILIPNAQYLNDVSLQVGLVRDHTSFSSIQKSQKIFLGVTKTFLVSSVQFNPPTPLTASELVISIQPSITLFEGSQVELHLRGNFTRMAQQPGMSVGGAQGSVFGWSAQWLNAYSSIVLTVAPQSVVLNDRVTVVSIPVSEGIILPSVLSENDRSLEIETINKAIILKEVVKQCGSIGDPKQFTNLMLDTGSPPVFEYDNSVAIAQSFFVNFTTNTYLLGGSVLRLHLGGFYRLTTNIQNRFTQPIRELELYVQGVLNPFALSPSGATWDADNQDLLIPLAGMGVSPYLETSIKIPADQLFVVPTSYTTPIEYGMFATVVDSGVVDEQFFNTTYSLLPEKTFLWSQLVYGLEKSPITDPVPESTTTISLLLQPSFDILANSVVRVYLPGFRFVEEIPDQETYAVPVTGNFTAILLPTLTHQVSYGHVTIASIASWNSTNSALEFAIQNITSDGVIPLMSKRDVLQFVFTNQFTIPIEKQINDESLQIEVVGAIVMPPEQIKNSPQLRLHTFEYLALRVGEPSDGNATVSVSFVPTVTIPKNTPILLGLGGFALQSNATAPTAISADCTFHSLQESQELVSSFPCAGVWHPDSETAEFVVPSLPLNSTYVSKITITAANGFTAPSLIDRDQFTLQVPNLIPSVFIADAPIQGTGPFLNQLYCITVLTTENAVRYHLNEEVSLSDAVFPNRVCSPATTDCESGSDWVTDPCAPLELERCGCQPNAGTGGSSLIVSGYNMTDFEFERILFFKNDEMNQTSVCDISSSTPYVQLSLGSRPLVSSTQIDFGPIRVIQTGKHFLCLDSMLVGTVFGRPDCTSPLVEYNYACVPSCPVGFVPRFGSCAKVDQQTLRSDTALSFSVAVVYENADALGLVDLPATDSTYTFFNYIALTNLKEILFEPDFSRFVLAELNDGRDFLNKANIPDKRPTDTVVMTIVIVPGGSGSNPTVRSTRELFALFESLVADFNSVLFVNSFFASVLTTMDVIPLSSAVEVKTSCGGSTSNAAYVIACPLETTPIPDTPSTYPAWYFVGAIVGGITGGIVGAAALVGIFRLDSSKGQKSFRQFVGGFDLMDQDNDFSIIKLEPPKTSSTVLSDVSEKRPLLSRVRMFYSEVASMDYATQAQFAKDWLDGKLLSEEAFLRPRRRVTKEPQVAASLERKATNTWFA